MQKLCLSFLTLFVLAPLALAGEPLPSWNDRDAKSNILQFVKSVTTEGGEHYVPPTDRIAVFDNDGTLWTEQPMYVQLAFAIDRTKAMAPKHPEWKNKEPFASVLRGNMKGVAASGEKGLVELILATHTGITTEEFEHIVKDWLATAKHPRYPRVPIPSAFTSPCWNY